MRQRGVPRQTPPRPAYQRQPPHPTGSANDPTDETTQAVQPGQGFHQVGDAGARAPGGRELSAGERRRSERSAGVG